MTSFLRFFILALPLLLGVTLTLGAALLFGMVATLLLTAVAALVALTRDQLKEAWVPWTVAGLSVVIVTLVDLVTSLWLPEVRAQWGIYLNLLAFSPLVVVLPAEHPRAADLGAELVLALKTGVLLIALFVTAALVRESLGRGTFTMVPGLLSWDIPGLKQYPLAILATGAGGFFLAAAGVVLYRVLRPKLDKLTTLTDFLGPERASVPVTAPNPVPETAQPLTVADDWGETLEGVVAGLPTGSGEKSRLLVIGSGNGELAYHLAMMCLDLAKSDKTFVFQVRGVDHFSTRIDTAVRGVYRDHQLDAIPKAVRETWMVRGQGEEKHLWKVAPEPRLHVQFEVADFQNGTLFFPQGAHLIVLNQGIEFVTDDKKAQIFKTVCDHLVSGGALVIPGSFKRELLPEGLKRTGTTVFRKA